MIAGSPRRHLATWVAGTARNGPTCASKGSKSRSRADAGEDEPEAYPPAGLVGNGASGPASLPAEAALAPRRYVVRGTGRWRVRAAPSMSSEALGTIAAGTVVVGYEVQGMDGGASSSSRKPAHTLSSTASFAALWVSVMQFEEKEQMGVQMKLQVADRAMFCLRRNHSGFGLYEVGVEPLEGPLVMLSDGLSSELRHEIKEASVARANRSSDVSFTWKLLGVAESITRFMTQEPASAEDLDYNGSSTVRRRPEHVFEARQREQLKEAAETLKEAVLKIISKLPAEGDAMAGLPKETQWRFARLYASLQATTAPSRPLVVKPGDLPWGEGDPAALDAGDPDATDQAALPFAGKAADLAQFVVFCNRMRRPDGWPQLSSGVKQDVIKFSMDCSRELENHARAIGKEGAGRGAAVAGSPRAAVAGSPRAAVVGSPPSTSRATASGLVPPLQALRRPSVTPDTGANDMDEELPTPATQRLPQGRWSERSSASQPVQPLLPPPRSRSSYML